MKKIIRNLGLLLLVLAVTGCGKTSSPDSFVEGTDYPYQYVSHESAEGCGVGMVRGKDGMYFSIGSYIYRMDEETKTIAPLCNKANCLHDKEKDDSRREECNAYTLEKQDVSISYMDGSIYFITSEWGDTESTPVLYRLAEDGSVREKVYQWDEDIVYQWCLHRGVLYYGEHTYDKKNQEHYVFRKLNISGTGTSKPETIYTPEEDVTVLAFSVPRAFGNHVYFSVNGTKKEMDDIDISKMPQEELLQYNYGKTIHYNIEDGTVSEIKKPGQSGTEHIGNVVFWQDKLLFSVSDYMDSHRYDVKNDVYLANLDGGNAKVYMKDMPSHRWYSSDGEYLYVSNCPECLDKIYHSEEYQNSEDSMEQMDLDFEMKVDVYDRNKKLVDTVEPPFHSFPTEPVYCAGDKMYVLVMNDSGDGISIEYWDKTKLGTYQGKEYQLTEVCEQKFSEKDLRKMEE